MPRHPLRFVPLCSSDPSRWPRGECFDTTPEGRSEGALNPNWAPNARRFFLIPR
jgi:hypothetical protein